MIKHLALWKLDESYSNIEKQNIKEEIRLHLLGLSGKVDELKAISVHFNSAEAAESNYDVLLDTEFNTIEDLNAYQVHPEHKKVVAYIKSLKLQRSCIDYEFQ